MRRQRLQRGWKPERVVSELRDQGEPIREDYYRGLEAGRKPGPDVLTALEALFGPMPPEPPKPAPSIGDQNAALLVALTEAVQAQTAAMREIVAELREAREATQGREEGMAAALGALAKTLASLRPALVGKSQ